MAFILKRGFCGGGGVFLIEANFLKEKIYITTNLMVHWINTGLM